MFIVVVITPPKKGATVEPIGPREGGTPKKAEKTAPPKERTDSHLAPDAPKKSAAPPKEHVDAPLSPDAPKKAPAKDDSDIPAAEPASEGKD